MTITAQQVDAWESEVAAYRARIRTTENEASHLRAKIARLTAALEMADEGQIARFNELTRLTAERDEWHARALAMFWYLPSDLTAGELKDSVEKAKAFIAERDALRAALHPFALNYQIGAGYCRDDFRRASEAMGPIDINALHEQSASRDGEQNA